MNHAARIDTPAEGRSEVSEGLDLEAFRVREGLTYERLAADIGVAHASQARRYAMGERWPDPDILDRIVAVTEGAVSILAMHRRRAAWLREHRGIRRVPVTCHGGETY